jgi:hypothetical protein
MQQVVNYTLFFLLIFIVSSHYNHPVPGSIKTWLPFYWLSNYSLTFTRRFLVAGYWDLKVQPPAPAPLRHLWFKTSPPNNGRTSLRGHSFLPLVCWSVFKFPRFQIVVHFGKQITLFLRLPCHYVAQANFSRLAGFAGSVSFLVSGIFSS